MSLNDSHFDPVLRAWNCQRKPSQIEQASHGAALSARASVFSTQGEPDRACSRSAWKIRQRQWPVKSRGATRFFQAIASHDFQRMFA